MTGSKRRALGTVSTAVGALLLVAAATPAAAGDRHDRRRSERVDHRQRGGWTAPAPPLVPRPRLLPHPRVLEIPRVIRGERRHAYAPYYAGRVFYAPYRAYLDVYYFPVRVGGRIVYEPHYYHRNELFFTAGRGGPRFFLRLDF